MTRNRVGVADMQFKQANREPSEPRVGIFWLYDGRLIIDSTPLSKAELYGDALTYALGHIDHWAVLQERGAVPIEVEYDEPPRGRVGYDTRRKEFLMFADRCIIENAAAVKTIIARLHLPEDTEPLTDLQYSCPVCLNRRRQQGQD